MFIISSSAASSARRPSNKQVCPRDPKWDTFRAFDFRYEYEESLGDVLSDGAEGTLLEFFDEMVVKLMPFAASEFQDEYDELARPRPGDPRRTAPRVLPRTPGEGRARARRQERRGIRSHAALDPCCRVQDHEFLMRWVRADRLCKS